MSSSPSSKQWRLKGSTSKSTRAPSGSVTCWVSRSIVRLTPTSSALCRNRRSTTASSNSSGSRPLLNELFLKISAKLGAIIQRIPNWTSAHTACSRLDPQPKFSRLRRIEAPAYFGMLSEKSGFGWRVALGAASSNGSRYRSASNRLGPKPVRLIDLRNCFGIIRSVSTLARSNGTTSPL